MTNVDEFWNESNADLVAVIRDEIRDQGQIRFDRFMELALYHPEHGYYRSENPAPGRAGDFLTAPEAHPIFGATLARQILAFDNYLDHPEPFSIVEYGAGSGRLIRPLLAELRQKHPDLYERVEYIPVELNESRMRELVEHLTDGGHADRLQMSPPDDGVVGCVLANEFFDAFPARRIVMSEAGLQEIFVDWADGWFVERQRPVVDQEINDYIQRHGFDLRAGESLEYHPGFQAWMNAASQTLARGFAMIIDYGYPAQELFSDHRRTGTLKGYYQHGATEQFYRGIGRQDLTAHVNFSEILHQAEQYGFSYAGLTNQADLLAALGIGDRLVDLQANPNLTSDEYLGVRAAVMRMIDPGSMGRFRVMFLSRDVDAGDLTRS